LEAQLGTKKLIRIPWGLQKRLVRVTVPPGSREGVLLRLSGLGKQMDEDKRGDLYLKVMIR
jgi:DnaJ-class molecular chaperone